MERYEVFYSSPDVLFYVAHTSWPTETTRRAKAKSLTVSEWGCCPCAEPNAHSRHTYLDPRHRGGNIARYFVTKAKASNKRRFSCATRKTGCQTCVVSLFLCSGEIEQHQLVFCYQWLYSCWLQGLVYPATMGVHLAALWRVSWDGESDKVGIKRPIFSHVCQAGQGCCLFEGGVTRLLQCGHRNTKQSRLCPRVCGKDLLSFLVLQFVQAQVVPTGWPPNRKHMESILTSQTLLYAKSLKSSLLKTVQQLEKHLLCFH